MRCTFTLVPPNSLLPAAYPPGLTHHPFGSRSRADAWRKPLLELRRCCVQRAAGVRQQGLFPVRRDQEAGEDGQGFAPLLSL